MPDLELASAYFSEARIADPDELKAALALRAEVAVESVNAERKRADLDAFDEELARHTPDEQLQRQYREELKASSDEEVRLSPERIEARAERRLGLESSQARTRRPNSIRHSSRSARSSPPSSWRRKGTKLAKLRRREYARQKGVRHDQVRRANTTTEAGEEPKR